MATVISIRSQDCSWSSLFTYITPFLPSATASGHVTTRGPSDPARIANRTKKVPLVPARGFVRIRNFAFLANRQRAMLLPPCFGLLRTSAQSSTSKHPLQQTILTLWNCPDCGGSLWSAAAWRLRWEEPEVRCGFTVIPPQHRKLYSFSQL